MASLLANSGISIAGRLSTMALGVVGTAIVGRVLGVGGYGYYALVLSFGSILHVITDGGLYLTLTREIARQPNNRQAITEAIIGLRVTVFAAVFLLGAGLLLLLPGYRGLLWLYGIAALGFLCQSLSQLLMGVFQAYGSLWQASLGDVVGRLVQLAWLALLAVGIATSAPTKLLIATSAFMAGAATTYLIHAYLVPGVSAWRMRFSTTQWRPIWRDSWPLAVMLVFNAIYFRIDMLILSYFRPGLEVGWYGLAYRIIESALFFPAAFGGLLLPQVSNAEHKRRRVLIEQALYAMLLLGGLILPLLGGLAGPIVMLLVGSAFAPAAPLLSVLTVALVIMLFGNIFGFTLVALRQQRSLLRLYAVLAVGNTIANIVFIPHFGATAAAWITVATEGCATAVAAYIVRRHMPYQFAWSMLARVMLASGAAVLVVWLLQGAYPVVVTAVSVAVVYIGLAGTFGLLRRQHVALLLQP